MKLLEKGRKKKAYKPVKTAIIELETLDVLCSSFEGLSTEEIIEREYLEEVNRVDEFDFP